MNEEQFLELAKAKYAEIHALKEAPTFLDYEQGFVELWTELGRQVAQANLGATGSPWNFLNWPRHWYLRCVAL